MIMSESHSSSTWWSCLCGCWYHWTFGGEIPKENTTILSGLLCKIKSWKGANEQTTVSQASQPVAQRGFTSSCSNPWKDEGPLITWTGLTVRVSCSGSSSGEQKSGAELVIQQKWLMIMDGVCSLWLNSPFSCCLLPSLHSSSVHLFSSLFLCYFMYSSSKFLIPSRFPAGLQRYQPATTVA